MKATSCVRNNAKYCELLLCRRFIIWAKKKKGMLLNQVSLKYNAVETDCTLYEATLSCGKTMLSNAPVPDILLTYYFYGILSYSQEDFKAMAIVCSYYILLSLILNSSLSGQW